MTTCTTYESSLETQIGLLKVSCCTKGVHSIHIIENDNPALYSSIVIKVFETVGGPKCLTDTLQWLKGYFEEKKTLPPDVCEMVINSKGPFMQLVWRTLKYVPFGTVLTYGELAKKCGRSKGAARAVGTAMRTNPVPLIVPCHRVVKEGGGLGRYSGGGGSRTKQWLLDHEWKVRAAQMREFIQDVNAAYAKIDARWPAERAAIEANAVVRADNQAGGAYVHASIEAFVAERAAAWADARAATEVACAAFEANVAERAVNQAAWADTYAALKAAHAAIKAAHARSNAAYARSKALVAASRAFNAARAAEGAARREAEEHIQQHHPMADGA